MSETKQKIQIVREFPTDFGLYVLLYCGAECLVSVFPLEAKTTYRNALEGFPERSDWQAYVEYLRRHRNRRIQALEKHGYEIPAEVKADIALQEL